MTVRRRARTFAADDQLDREVDMSATGVDEAKLEEFMGRMVGYMTGGAACFCIWLGDELGLVLDLGRGCASADEVAAEAGCHPRLVREWLDGQAAAGLIDYDPETDSYSIAPRPGWRSPTTPHRFSRPRHERIRRRCSTTSRRSRRRSGATVDWPGAITTRACSRGRSGSSAPATARILPNDGFRRLKGSRTSSKPGARVADIGCGHGASVVVMAEAYPNSPFYGFDYHAPSIETARQRAVEAGVADRTTFEVAEREGLSGHIRPDLLLRLPARHGRSRRRRAYAREHLEQDGTVLLVEPFALDGRAANSTGNPMAALLYTASTAICTPNSLSQEVGLGLGAQAGEARLRAVFEEAGFSRFRRAAETPMNLILEARS